MVDPGIGFGKTVAHNLELLRRLDEIAALGFTVLLGTSRKGFLGSSSAARTRTSASRRRSRRSPRAGARRAVKLPFTWPNSSDSSSVSGRPAQLTGDEDVVCARPSADGAGHDFLPDAALAGDQHLGVRSGHTLDFLAQLLDQRAGANEQWGLAYFDSHALSLTRLETV